jgi:hypothetical protein
MLCQHCAAVMGQPVTALESMLVLSGRMHLGCSMCEDVDVRNSLPELPW